MSIIPHSKPMPSKELRIYKSLLPRKNLSANEKHHYENLHKGYIGEQKFSDLLHNYPSPNRIALFDFLLESNNTEFQIDSLIISHNTIFPLEIKYFEGDFYVENDKWYVIGSGKEIRSPLLQLQRTEFLFKQILQKINVNLAVKPYVVFNNEKFTLYQAPLGQPIIFPTQLERFIKMLNSSSRNLTNHHTKLAEQLISLHIEESANSRLPKYEFSQLKRGVICKLCPNFLYAISKVQLKCKNCGRAEDVEAAVMRSVIEFNLLFPERKITTSMIHEWCAVIESKKSIRRILMKNMRLVRNGKYSYYMFNTL